MDIGVLDPSLQQLTTVGLGSIASSRPQPATEVREQASQRQSSAGIVLSSNGAEEAAERLSYDQPSGRQGKAVVAYESVSRQEKRDQLQQMLRVDMYA